MATQGRRRALGQHFLKDRGIARMIAHEVINLATQKGCHSLLEIGPGKGAITLPLLELIGPTPQPPLQEFIIAERDMRIVEEWRHYFAEHPTQGTRVEPGDFLELPEERWLNTPPLAVASNLPYSAGTAILTRLARQAAKIPFMVLMFQAEVARRLRADTGTKEWGSLSIWIQNRWTVKKLASVPPSAFRPPPDVDSEVVILTRRELPRIEVQDEALWENLLKVFFAHRRKMLRSALPTSGP